MLRTTGTIAALLLAAGGVVAQPAEPFFARKTISISIGYTAGGSYDLYGRLVARHLGKHLPGRPAVIAQNMPGAGSLKAANYLYEVAPKDGTALGVIVESAALEQALANPGVQFDAAKFVYIGRIATSNNIFMQWHSAKVQSLEDARRLDTSLAGTGPGSIAETVPRLLNALIGTRIQADQRISRVKRGHDGDGARRGRGRLLVVGGSQGRQADLAAREEDPDHPADRTATRHRVAGRA